MLFRSDKKIQLKEGQSFTLTSRKVDGDETTSSISYPNLIYDIEIGSTILIDDGLVEMVVTDVTSTDIICKVIVCSMSGLKCGRRSIAV